MDEIAGRKLVINAIVTVTMLTLYGRHIIVTSTELSKLIGTV